MNEKTKKGILLAGYCVPYVFLCMYGDVMLGTGLLYAVSAAAMFGLCYFTFKTEQLKLVLIGNVLSFGFSHLLVLLTGLAEKNYYFKPLTVHSMVNICTVIAVLIQWYMISRMKTGKRDRWK